MMRGGFAMPGAAPPGQSDPAVFLSLALCTTAHSSPSKNSTASPTNGPRTGKRTTTKTCVRTSKLSSTTWRSSGSINRRRRLGLPPRIVRAEWVTGHHDWFNELPDPLLIDIRHLKRSIKQWHRCGNWILFMVVFPLLLGQAGGSSVTSVC
jgi:hypothetical protein